MSCVEKHVFEDRDSEYPFTKLAVHLRIVSAGWGFWVIREIEGLDGSDRSWRPSLRSARAKLHLWAGDAVEDGLRAPR